MQQPNSTPNQTRQHWFSKLSGLQSHLLILGLWLLWWPLVDFHVRWLLMLPIIYAAVYVLIGIPWRMMQSMNGKTSSSLFRFRLPREGVYWLFAAGVLLLVSWLKAINLILLLAYVMLLLWSVNFFLAGRGLSRLQARRRLDDTVVAGAACAGEIEVSNPGDAVQYGIRFIDRRDDQQDQWFAARLDPGQKVSFTRTIRWPRRGRFTVPPLQAVSGYPFGLVQRSADLGAPLEVLVLPALGKLDADKFRRFLSYAERGDHWESQATRRQPMGPAELHAIRPYHPGDSQRSIHWRTTARRGELMVREFEEESSENLVLIVDTWTPLTESKAPNAPRRKATKSLPATPDELTGFEDVISLAATICQEAGHEKSPRITLVIAGPQPVVIASAPGPAGSRRMLESLASVSVRPEYSHYEMLDVLTELPAGPLLVLGVEPDGLARTLQAHRQASAVVLRAADLDRCEFYEKPHAR